MDLSRTFSHACLSVTMVGPLSECEAFFAHHAYFTSPLAASPHPRVPVSPHPRGSQSPCPRVPVSPCLRVSVSPRLRVPVSPRPRVPSLQGHANRLDNLFQNRFSLFAPPQRRRETRADQYAVSKDRQHQSFDIVGDAIGSFLSEGQGLSRAKQG